MIEAKLGMIGLGVASTFSDGGDEGEWWRCRVYVAGAHPHEPVLAY